MKLHNTQTSGQAECPDPLWELIPWYVNKSLPEDEAIALQRHAETCLDCTAEIARQHVVSKEVATTEPFEGPLAQSWETLRAQIEADTRARTPKKGGFGRIKGFPGGLNALFGTVAAACLLAIVLVWQPTPEGFRTLTSGSETAVPMIKFQAIPKATKAELVALLAEQGATLLSGPSDLGIYTAALTQGADVEAVANTLMATSVILFAAPEVE